MIKEYVLSALSLAAVVTLLLCYRRYSKRANGKASPYAAMWWVLIFIVAFVLYFLGAVYKKGEDFNLVIAFTESLSAAMKQFTFDFRTGLVSALAADNTLYLVAIIATFIASWLWTISITILLIFKGLLNEISVFLHAHSFKKRPHYIVVGCGERMEIFLKNLLKTSQKSNITVITGETTPSGQTVEVIYKSFLGRGFTVVMSKADSAALVRVGINNRKRLTYVVAMTDSDEENLAVAECVTNAVARQVMDTCSPNAAKIPAAKTRNDKADDKLDEFLEQTLKITRGNDSEKKKEIADKIKGVKLHARIMYTLIDRVEHFAFAENAFGKVVFFNPSEIMSRKFFWNHPITDGIGHLLDYDKARLKGEVRTETIVVKKNGCERKVVRDRIIKQDGSDYRINHIFVGFDLTNYYMLKNSVISDQLLGCDYNAIVFDNSFIGGHAEKQATFVNNAPGLFGECEAILDAKYFESPNEQYNIEFKNIDILSRDFYQKLQKATKNNDFTPIYVSLGDDKLSVEVAMGIRQSLVECGVDLTTVRLFVKIEKDSSFVSEKFLNSSKHIPLKIECFGKDEEFLTESEIVANSLDHLAIVLSSQYHGVDWGFSSEFERNSNRSKIMNLRVMLGFMGLDISIDGDGALPADDLYKKRYGLSDKAIAHLRSVDTTADKAIRLKYLLTENGDVNGKALDTSRNNLARREHLRWNAFHLANGWTKKPISLVGGRNGMDDESKYFSTDRAASDLGRKNMFAKQHACITTFEGLIQLRKLQAECVGGNEEDYDTVFYDFVFLDRLPEKIKAVELSHKLVIKERQY